MRPSVPPRPPRHPSRMNGPSQRLDGCNGPFMPKPGGRACRKGRAERGWPASAEAEFVQSLVVDAEVVTHLVGDGDGDFASGGVGVVDHVEDG